MPGIGISKDCKTHKVLRVELTRADLDQQTTAIAQQAKEAQKETEQKEEDFLNLHLKKDKAIQLGRTDLADSLQTRINALEVELQEL